MKIILIRHFKVNCDRRFAYNSQTYENAFDDYNKSPVIESDLRISTNNKIYSSTMVRTIETAKTIFNKAPDFYSDLLCEVPISPFMKTRLFLPLIVWNFVGRIQWRFNSKKQPETYLATQARIDKFMDSIITQNEDCFIVAHGFTIKLIIRRLKAENFRGLNPMLIKNGLPYEYSK